MVEIAKALMDRGWYVFPVQGKVPTTLKGLNDASTDHRMADIWWERHPGRGIALATGKVSGVWVLDLDGDEGRQSFLALQEANGNIPHTVAAKTSRGFHLYFQMPEAGEIRNSAGKVGQGIDVRGSGGYVVVPPSPHPDGGSYSWVSKRSPDDCETQQAPGWLMALVLAQPQRVHAGAVESEIIEGGRNQTLTSLGGTMRRRGMARDAILAALKAENELKCAPPLDDGEVERIADSVARYEPAPTNGTCPQARLDVVNISVLERIGAEKQKPVDAVPTPWPKWNRACRGAGGGVGLARGWNVIVGASSGAGKSLVAANLAASAIRGGVDVCLFSLEMSLMENVTRVLAILSGEPIASLEHGRAFDPDVWASVSERFAEQPGSLRTNDKPIHSLDDIRDAMWYHADEGCRLMIVDYLQLAWTRNAETLYHQITEVSHTIRGLAKDLDVTTVGLSQVNRKTSSGAEKLQKEGLMGGSSLENDAEQVVLLDKSERVYDGFESEVRLDKNRHGPVAEWTMYMDPRTLRMMEKAES